MSKFQKKPVKSLTADQKQEIKESFELFDSDKNNKLDYHEFRYFISPIQESQREH